MRGPEQSAATVENKLILQQAARAAHGTGARAAAAASSAGELGRPSATLRLLVCSLFDRSAMLMT